MTKPHVYVVDRGKSRGLCFRWKDPETGKWREQKCGTNRRGSAERDAEKKAIELEREYLKARLGKSQREGLRWVGFCERYESEHVGATSAGNEYKWNAVKGKFDAFLTEQGLSDLPLADFNAGIVNSFRTWLKQNMSSPASAVSYFATFIAGLRYAMERELCPVIMVARKRGGDTSTESPMKGRAVTSEEFDRIVMAIPKVVGADRVEGFERTLKMIWLGGLRRSEPLMFHTDRQDCHRFTELYDRQPKVTFHSSQKNKKRQVVAMTPEWAAYARLLELAPGWICNPINDRGWRITSPTELGRFIAKFCKQANVIVTPAMDGQPAKFATAQNLRQGFGYRWATKVMPATLQHLMRHRDIKTTMKYYAGADADAVASVIMPSAPDSRPMSHASKQEKQKSL